ncbi:P-loop containing nucleoside triphosphate hydrolase protein [Syncephalastrum racemosum]|uniref:Kinesin-like protein n=1 Tax=Syncephalastrum racemosum TaxID=13706 RepID=A0A1X2H269_SYNRA|nr:P-loop containing nucleoside triphosphate hydrolase protein [Syncephalastrum racemosum]
MIATNGLLSGSPSSSPVVSSPVSTPATAIPSPSLGNAASSPSSVSSAQSTNPIGPANTATTTNTNTTTTNTTGIKTPQSYRRRPTDNSLLSSSIKSSNASSGIPERRLNPSLTPQGSPSATHLPAPQTRSRSRTLPDQAQRPDFKSAGRSPGQQQNQEYRFNLNQPDDFGSEEDEEEKCEIRRGSGPLLDPYGVPMAGRQRPNIGQRSNTFANSPGTSPASAFAAASVASSTHAIQSDLNQKIRVCVRKRPLNKKELERGEKDISPTAGIRSINVNEPKTKVDLTKYIEQHSFTYDDVFDYDAKNDQVYQRTAQPLVKYIFGGGKATCFAYGQTGSGKTFTMLDPQYGLYVLAARDIFNMLKQPEYEHLSAWIGFYEIYQGQLYDLLNNRKKLFAREDGKQNVVIVGLKEYVIKNVNDLMQVFEFGSQARSTGSTGANSDSSRSHAILQILLKPVKSRKKIVGKLSFIDLAGSERGADRGDADAKTRMEGAEINKSLLALKECIRALDQDKRHTPFRQSKLTQVLKDSFVGNSRTCMIATISPNQSNSEHTLNTLRYADRVKELKGERDRRVLTTDTENGTRQAEEVGYSNDNDYADDDYGESDEMEMYNEGDDDDLFLDEEYFPSDGDVNILDEDFPHENQHQHQHQHHYHHQHHHSPQQQHQQQHRYYPDDRRSTPHPRGTKAGGSTRTQIPRGTSGGGGGGVSGGSSSGGSGRGSSESEPRAASMTRASSSPEPMYDPSDFSRSRHGSGSMHTQPRQQQLTSMHRSHSTASAGLYNNPPSPPPLPSHAQHHISTLDSADIDDLMFDQNTIDDFIKFHRAEIREVAECSKKETKILANFSLNLTSLKELQESRADEKLRMSSEFIDYLDRLDEVLEMKIGAIDALRDRIRRVLGEEDDI